MATTPPTQQDSDHPVAGDQEYNLTTLKDVHAYLHRRGLDDVTLDRLTGGTANWVYRLTTPTGTKVLKHAAPELASSGFALGTERMGFEARFLERATGAGRHVDVGVRIPAFDFYDDQAKLLCMGDAGSRNLRDAYPHLPAPSVADLGARLGAWLQGLHARTPREWVTGEGGNNDIGVRIAGYTYGLLGSTLAAHQAAGVVGGDVEGLSEAVGTGYAALIRGDEACVCHGDFWPGNVVLGRESGGEARVRATVVDWELTRVGSSSTDIGQFAAEAYMLDLFHGGKGLLPAFIRAYFKAAGVRVDAGESEGETRTWMARIAVHFAVHIAVWPGRGVHWARGEDTGRLVREAVGVLRDVLAGGIGVGFWAMFDGIDGSERLAQG